MPQIACSIGTASLTLVLNFIIPIYNVFDASRRLGGIGFLPPLGLTGLALEDDEGITFSFRCGCVIGSKGSECVFFPYLVSFFHCFNRT